VSVWRQLRAIGPLPFAATVVVPTALALGTEPELAWWRVPLGLVPIAVGLTLVYRTIDLFARVGEGTLAPWDPPRKLVVEGPYRRWRHPMISGVALILAGETIALWTLPTTIWLAAFVAVNAVYLPLVEEPRLVRRFGADYEEYRRQVPRFLPRVWSC
jgi:protein-S-isoprenylcysteine O-methyltransferase Ste14